jgi:hypothetical protein
MGRGDTGEAMDVIRTGGRAEEYIMADHLPPHNYGVRPWGVGFEMSPGQHDIDYARIVGRHHKPLHIPPTDLLDGGTKDIMFVTRPTTTQGRACGGDLGQSNAVVN